jgi:hypothetical protein
VAGSIADPGRQVQRQQHHRQRQQTEQQHQTIDAAGQVHQVQALAVGRGHVHWVPLAAARVEHALVQAGRQTPQPGGCAVTEKPFQVARARQRVGRVGTAAVDEVLGFQLQRLAHQAVFQHVAHRQQAAGGDQADEQQLQP